ALAAAVGASVCEIYTDVEGVLTADPRLVPKAGLIPRISYEECLELASLGAQVIHSRAVELGELYRMPIHVRSSAHRRPGTMILPEAEIDMEERKRVRGIAHEYGVAKVTVKGVPDQPGVAAAILEPLSEAGVSVDVIVQNISTHQKVDLTFTCAESDLPRVEPLVREAATQTGALEVLLAIGAAKVSLIGTGMVGAPGVAARMFRTLATARVNIQMITTAEIRITCLVDHDEVERAVRALHVAFQLDEDEEEVGQDSGTVALCP
ncbi:MAG: aspartate kinase, partial [Candidatus Dormibacteraceae bacterium]